MWGGQVHCCLFKMHSQGRFSLIAHCTLWTFLLLVKHGTAQTEDTLSFNIEEELPINTLVGTIGSVCAPPPYTILSLKTGYEQDLSVDKYSGQIRTKSVLDRERRDQYQFLAISEADSDCRDADPQISVIVHVDDINDHAPVFHQKTKHLPLSETTPRDAKYPLGSATDPDLGINSTQRYEIIEGNTQNTFRLGTKRSRNSILYLDLEINGALDYETMPSYNLVIRAYDGQGRFDTMRVEISISDVNDNQPIFNQTRYSARVAENATIGTPVAQVFATDRDSGENGHVEYYIDRQRSDQNENFDINPTTGMIYVNKDLDYEVRSTYELIVVARDNGPQRSQTTAIVSIKVLDVNDNEPTISIKFLSSDGSPKISEISQPGDYVARISVSDPDLPSSYFAHVNVTLQGGDGHFGLTTRDNVVYLVILSKPLDREIKPFYQMTITATDSGTPPLKSTKDIQVYVIDANDNAPEFSQSTYYADIQEVVPVGASVILISAQDTDEGDNSKLTYSMEVTPSTHSDWFAIDNRTGLITTKTRLDCETSSEPRLTVVVTDAGVPPLSASTVVIVRIQDVNDNQPIFDQSFYNVTVPEDRGIGNCLIKVSASDPDCGASARVTYQIALNLGFEHPRDFQINNRTGEICIAKSLDHERRQTYEFPIIAKDQDGLETTSMVKITVRDVNDNAPIFVPHEYNVNLDQNAGYQADVVVVKATDTDSGSFGDVSYVIVSGNSQNVFNIDSNSGLITLASSLPSYPTVYNLIVQARDAGGMTSQVNAKVSISVLDGSQRPPQFTEQLYTFSVREDVSTQTKVGEVTASNTNPGAGSIRYSIVSGDPSGYFSINERTGEIRTQQRLDYTTQPNTLLNVLARSGNPPSYGRAQVQITIEDVNDNAPQFEVNNVEFPVKEDTAVDSVIYVSQATDKDGGDNGRLTYTLQQDPATPSTFNINPNSAAISLRRPLDYETRKEYRLVITARDNAPIPKQTSMTLHIIVQDVNDNSPVFRQESYSVTLLETTPPNTKFIQVTAGDKDMGNNGRVTYLLKNSPNLDKFGIFPDGSLYNRVYLDREIQEDYLLHVIAMDSGIPPRSSLTEVQIQVLDANDNSPVFSEEAYVFHVMENAPSGTLLGSVSAIDHDQTDNLHLQYYIATDNDYLAVKRDTGEVLLKASLDHERQKSLTLTVQVTDGGTPPLTASVNVEVKVLDMNDNSPIFDHHGAYQATVDENKPKGTFVIQVSARDQDEGENGTVTYHFADGAEGRDAGMFNIHHRTGRITTREVLDHERKPDYQFKVIARDGGQPQKETSKTVIVTVNDINESPPLFEKKEVTFYIDENIAPGTIIGNVKANDTDSGENGRVVYYLMEGNLFGIFKLNETTGNLIVSKPVDYEISSSYSLIIRALDNSVSNPMSSSIVVHIRVRDHNDNAPIFEQDPLVINVRENEPLGSAVFTFSALDLDSGPRGTVHYSIESQSPDDGWFSIDSTTGVLRVAAAIDHEEIQQISVQVKATDQPGPSEDVLSTTVTALVIVHDMNDNQPQFQTRDMVDILEDEPIGYPIEHVLASDKDSKENGRISYAIVSGNEKGHFRVDSSTGLLSIARTLDRESKQTFKLNITARDHGYPQRASFMTLSVHVIDVNDNPPAFQHSVYNASIEENQPANTEVTTIHATDPDTGKNAHLQYLIPYGIADDHFTIDETSGVIRTKELLDREERSQWVITAYVKDDAFPALYDTATVLVKVEDHNDNAPTFMESRYQLTVPENAQQTVIHTVVARDADGGPNGQVQYRIIAGNSDNRFFLNPESGELSCRPLDRETGASYNLTIMASDGGVPPRSNTAVFSITVLDENDNNPVFRQAYYEKTIAENITVGTEILAVTADDADEGVNAEILYSISNATEGLFKIDNRTGVILTAGEFDREKKSMYTFEVDATDGGRYGPRSKKVRVTVYINDVNDNTPVFEQIPYKASISANHGVRQYVVKVVAVDKDEGSNGEVVYSFSRPSRYFEVNSDTGIIETKALLDPAAIDVHTLEVIARDRGNPSRSSTGLVEISVGNAQGISTLKFANQTYNVNIPENLRAGTSVTTVTARFDSGGSGSITYSFANGNEDYTFNIHPSTGRITVSDPRKLDYESNPRLRLIVVATADTAYGYTTVWVNLLDVNDNDPKFTQERYISSVFEGNPKGTYVTQISASDDDSGDNGRVTYSIIGGNIQNAFIIEPPNTGIVKTNFILDREIHAFYRLDIEAVDNGVPPRTSRCTLRIAVNDINDNAPFFPYYPPKNLHEGQEPGTLVLQVTANDKDLKPVLRYDFTRDGNPGNAFSIDRYSGKITIIKELDYESRSQYILRVQAVDGSDGKYNATTNVTINILDRNDNVPEFAQSDYQVELPELTLPNTKVVTVNATDRDAGENSRLTYSLSTRQPFYIDPKTGTIFTNETVRFNTGERIINLIVKAQDHGTPRLSQTVHVSLQVIDINNHAPVFDQPSYSAEVREDAKQAMTILTVAASDHDFSHDNSKVDFSLVKGNEDGEFQITSNGEILLVGSLDHERVRSYSLVVMAKDRGEPALNSTAEVKITVTDVNDNAPIFSPRNYTVVVKENITIGTEVVRVRATDLDTAENARIRYQIKSGNDFNNFVIDQQSGVITVRRKLDYETQPAHRLVVQAEDSATRFLRKSTFTIVMINTTDVNEFKPHFPVMMYLESVREGQDTNSPVFTAHANDQDKGEYGVVTYSLQGPNNKFRIDPVSGVVYSNERFTYGSDKDNYRFTVIATDIGGQFDDVPVSVNILPKVEALPQFTKHQYSFSVPGNATVGYEVGQVQAINQEDGKAGLVKYYFRQSNEFFTIDQLTGVITVVKDLQDTSDKASNRKRRFVPRYDRVKRALEGDQVSLTIVASSDLPSLKGKTVEATAVMYIDRSCPGCQMAQASTGEGSGTILVIVVVLVIVAVVVSVVLLIVYLRNRDRKRRPPETNYDSSYDASDVYPPAPIRDLPPTYNEIQHFPSARHHSRSDHNVTTSEISEQSHSASSGRGSAEDGEDVDEEIRMINETPLQVQNVRMPDSGIQQDDDTISEQSIQNHQEYLARLGIDSTKLNTKAPPPGLSKPGAGKKPPVGSSVESMHQFSDEGGGEGVGLDLPSLVYSKLTEVASEENMAIMDGTRQFGHGETTTEPSHAGSLSSVINSEEEFSGSYNWDYLLDWGPQYQPLAHVFAEIARLKDDSIKPKKQPTHIVPQRPNLTALNSQAVNKTGPPPLLTNAPPMAVLAQPITSRPSQSNSSSSSSVAVHSSRTSQLTSLPSLPRSPISHESSYTSPALSPSFTPSLSPLATRSPSISPLVSTKGGSGHSSSGQNTPQRHRLNNNNHHHHHITLTNTGSSESEQEIRI